MQEVRGRRKMVSLCSLITLADIGSLDASGVLSWFPRAKITARTTSLLPLHHHMRGTTNTSLILIVPLTEYDNPCVAPTGPTVTYFIFQSSSGSLHLFVSKVP